MLPAAVILSALLSVPTHPDQYEKAIPPAEPSAKVLMLPLSEAIAAQHADADATQQQAEASISAVESDMRKMSSFGEEVKQLLTQQERVKQGITHAIGYWRKIEAEDADQRDGLHAQVARLEAEVATLQKRILDLEAERTALISDKTTLSDANRKVALTSPCTVCLPCITQAACNYHLSAVAQRRSSALASRGR